MPSACSATCHAVSVSLTGPTQASAVSHAGTADMIGLWLKHSWTLHFSPGRECLPGVDKQDSSRMAARGGSGARELHCMHTHKAALQRTDACAYAGGLNLGPRRGGAAGMHGLGRQTLRHAGRSEGRSLALQVEGERRDVGRACGMPCVAPEVVEQTIESRHARAAAGPVWHAGSEVGCFAQVFQLATYGPIWALCSLCEIDFFMRLSRACS